MCNKICQMYVFEVLGCGKANYNYFDTCANHFAVTLEMDCKCAMSLIRKIIINRNIFDWFIE